MKRIITILFLLFSFISFSQTYTMRDSRPGDTVQRIIQTTKTDGIVKYLFITGTDTAEIRWDGTKLLINGYNLADSTDLTTDSIQELRSDMNKKVDSTNIRLYNTGNSVFIGENAGLEDDLTDNHNVLIGDRAGINNSGTYSNGVGAGALYNNTGNNSNGIGYGTLEENTGDSSNGFGANALASNTGSNSNGFGYYALENNTGYNSNGFGIGALRDNTGNFSNGFGDKALGENTGDYSNGFGAYALASNTGEFSNGFGASTLEGNTGNYANGFGSSALKYNTGANNTAVGHNASSNNPFAYTNTTALGYNVQPNASNQVMLGDANITAVYMGQNGQATTIQTIIKLIPSTAPTTPTEGMIYSGTDHHLYYYNGSSWIQLDN